MGAVCMRLRISCSHSSLLFVSSSSSRELLGKKRRNENANWIWIGGKIGARDAYIEGELAAKRKAEAAAQ
jgi:hypothetical protein